MSEENKDAKYVAHVAWANTILWLGFWFLVIGGCTSSLIWGR